MPTAFTEDLTKDRAIAHGNLESVASFKKGDDCIWRSMAMQGGKEVQVAVDYKANVVTKATHNIKCVVTAKGVGGALQQVRGTLQAAQNKKGGEQKHKQMVECHQRARKPETIAGIAPSYPDRDLCADRQRTRQGQSDSLLRLSRRLPAPAVGADSSPRHLHCKTDNAGNDE